MKGFNHKAIITTIVLFFTLSITVATAGENSYKIYLDADFTGTKTSSISIQQGINVALSEENFIIDNIRFELVAKNHRGNSLRSKRNLEKFLKDEQALIVFSGLHSPPLLANKEFINSNKILMLDPWAAAGPITRPKNSNNWIYRLSIDDSNAGKFISAEAVKEKFRKPFLLLEDTGWGKSNERTMKKALASNDIAPVGVTWFNWGLGINHAKVLLRDIKSSGADVIFFVGNAPEGKTFANAMISLNQEIRLPIRSHWGITGGDFAQIINAKARAALDLRFIQTKFSFLSQPSSKLAQQVFEKTKMLYPQIKSVDDIKAQTGFIHGYDLTKILIAAMKQARLTGIKKNDMKAIKQALENLKSPVAGLIKDYHKPFSTYSLDNKSAHEALSIQDYAMGHYQSNNSIALFSNE
ncbi:MAG: ABC transporter substrate-binding protein [Colwellia sp.]|nr:ABC transporter substrate-binding protein [Colwellia sp.]